MRLKETLPQATALKTSRISPSEQTASNRCDFKVLAKTGRHILLWFSCVVCRSQTVVWRECWRFEQRSPNRSHVCLRAWEGPKETDTHTVSESLLDWQPPVCAATNHLTTTWIIYSLCRCQPSRSFLFWLFTCRHVTAHDCSVHVTPPARLQRSGLLFVVSLKNDPKKALILRKDAQGVTAQWGL